jgi:hypothetical protein
MKETADKIVVFGHGNGRFDIPKSEIIAVGMNVIVRKNFPELFIYKVNKNSPLPSGEPLAQIDEEAYPEYYHGPKEDETEVRWYTQSEINLWFVISVVLNKCG